MMDDQIHWFSIINSLMIVLFLSGMVAMIMMRTLHRDISNYNQLETAEEVQDETGWKLVRTPARFAGALRFRHQCLWLASLLGEEQWNGMAAVLCSVRALEVMLKLFLPECLCQSEPLFVDYPCVHELRIPRSLHASHVHVILVWRVCRCTATCFGLQQIQACWPATSAPACS
jgi:hypothetical protein